MFGTLVDICKTILDYVRAEGELRSETRLRVSSILEEISNVLKDTSEKLKNDEYPHFNCVILERLSDNLHFNLIEHVKPDQLDNLHSLLKEASQIEKLYNVRKEPNTIIELEKTSAEFKSLSILMKF